MKHLKRYLKRQLEKCVIIALFLVSLFLISLTVLISSPNMIYVVVFLVSAWYVQMFIDANINS